MQAPQQPVQTGYSINQFLTNLYGQVPDKRTEGNHTIYSYPIANCARVLVDPVGGCHVQIPQNAPIPENMKKEISHLSQFIAETHLFDSLWIDISMPAPDNILGLCPDTWQIDNPQKGNIITDVQEGKICIWQWLNADKTCQIPKPQQQAIVQTSSLPPASGPLSILDPRALEDQKNQLRSVRRPTVSEVLMMTQKSGIRKAFAALIAGKDTAAWKEPKAPHEFFEPVEAKGHNGYTLDPYMDIWDIQGLIGVEIPNEESDIVTLRQYMQEHHPKSPVGFKKTLDNCYIEILSVDVNGDVDKVFVGYVV